MDSLNGIKIIIFDMDGTLLNTLPDLTDSVNYVLKQYNFPQKSKYEISAYIGNGVAKLIERAIPFGKSNENYNDCLSMFKKHYKKNMYNKTRPYNNIITLLNELKKRNIKIAVVSNKFDIAVKNLTNKYFSGLVDIAIGENEEKGIKKKPSPDMVLKALSKFGYSLSEALYIGDSDTDIQTAKNASIKCISVTWGYRTKGFLNQNGAFTTIDSPLEIFNYI